MSRYDALWAWIAQNGTDRFTLSFADIERIVGFPLNHAFLSCKKELLAMGWKVVKISMKEQTVLFERLPPNDQVSP